MSLESNSTIFQDLLGIPDVRSLQYPFIENPLPSTTLVFFYIYFVKYLGPSYMKNRQPFQMKGIIMLFNLVVAGINGYICFKMYHYTNFNFVCDPINLSETHTKIMIPLGYLFLVMKYIELLDTVFFVLRKKDNLVTVLHMFHHVSITFVVWVAFKYHPGGGEMAFSAIINSFVHLIMYSYYFLACLGPEYKRYLWWKKYLTLLQMTQLLAASLLGLPSVFGYCPMPKVFGFLYITYGPALLILFGNYYIQTHIRNHKKCID